MPCSVTALVTTPDANTFARVMLQLIRPAARRLAIVTTPPSTGKTCSLPHRQQSKKGFVADGRTGKVSDTSTMECCQALNTQDGYIGTTQQLGHMLWASITSGLGGTPRVRTSVRTVSAAFCTSLLWDLIHLCIAQKNYTAGKVCDVAR